MAVRRDAPAFPWRVGDCIAVLTMNAVGLVLIWTGYYIAARSADPSRELLATNVAVGGIIVALAANAVWLLSGLREIAVTRRELLGRGVLQRPAGTADARDADDTDLLGPFVSAPAMSLYHRPSCPLAQGKAVRAESLRAHQARHREPCPICRPHAAELPELATR